MSNWRIRLTNGNTTTELELIDTAGPLNDFRFVDLEAFTPAKGTFTNQFNNVVPTTPLTWILKGLDIDEDEPTSGKGEVHDSGGTFPNGEMDWEKLSKL
ncbi:hypothetical protein [Massilia sp. DD77]|uniref:hypothetical protein n=1 Tax=Massilia sp. DD77 TaxID=3109349 RepID=UPI002FFEF072